MEPLIAPAKRGGNRRTVDVREVVNGLMYVLSSGCQWRAIPKDLPPRSTVCTVILTCGLGTARSIASIMRSTYNVVSWPTENPARVPPSSIVKASRARKKGGLY